MQTLKLWQHNISDVLPRFRCKYSLSNYQSKFWSSDSIKWTRGYFLNPKIIV